LETINSDELKIVLEDLGINEITPDEVIPLIILISKDYDWVDKWKKWFEEKHEDEKSPQK
jgi:hypothetical protein